MKSYLTLLWARTAYRPLARLLHRFNLHHSRHIGPLEPGGGFVERCDWCGLSRSYYPSMEAALRAAEAKRGTGVQPEPLS